MMTAGADRPNVLLVDYGMVISLAQPAASVEAMASLLRLPGPTFEERYWEHRPLYDQGAQPGAYWSLVAGRELPDLALLRELSRLDVESWSHLNPETLAVLEAVRRDGGTLSLLSNCPHDLAAELDRMPALSGFRHRLYSARLGVVKPEPAVFEAALRTMGRRPDEVLFIDDRPVNVEGALAVGLDGLLFTSPGQLREALLGGR